MPATRRKFLAAAGCAASLRLAEASLRAAGAFLVSAAWDGGQTVSPIAILRERGATLQMIHPWGAAKLQVTQESNGQSTPYRQNGQMIEFDTHAGERYRIKKV